MERKSGTYGLADFYADHRRKRPNFLEPMAETIKWSRIEKLLQNALGRGKIQSGVKSYPALIMFKVLLLQSWYNLSDQETEYALCDRVSFCRFAGFSIDDETPDHTTICRFRNLLLEKRLLKKLLDEINRQLEEQGKIIKTGCIVDASIISSAAHPMKKVDIEEIAEDRKECETSSKFTIKTSFSHDNEATWTYKGGRYHYGYKVHAATDCNHGFVLSAHITPAHRADTLELSTVVKNADLCAGSRVYADKGYTSKSNSDFLSSGKLRNGIMEKAQRGHPLLEHGRKRNRLISRVRGTVERTFEL